MTEKTMQKSVYDLFNPQFFGIGHKLEKEKSQRKSLEHNQEFMSTRVTFLQKESAKAKKLQRSREKELQRLYEIANRKTQEDYEKQEQHRLNQIRKQELRKKAQSDRLQRQKSKKVIFQSLYSFKNLEASQLKTDIRQSLDKKTMGKHMELIERQNQVSVLKIDRIQSKKRITEFYKHKNDNFTQDYMRKIHQQKRLQQKKQGSIRFLEEREKTLADELSLKSSQIDTLQKTIEDFYDHRKIISSKRKSKEAIYGARLSRVNYGANEGSNRNMSMSFYENYGLLKNNVDQSRPSRYGMHEKTAENQLLQKGIYKPRRAKQRNNSEQGSELQWFSNGYITKQHNLKEMNFKSDNDSDRETSEVEK